MSFIGGLLWGILIGIPLGVECILSYYKLYRCPVCGKWIRLGKDGTNCQQSDNSWILCHGKYEHRHSPGWHGIGGKPLE